MYVVPPSFQNAPSVGDIIKEVMDIRKRKKDVAVEDIERLYKQTKYAQAMADVMGTEQFGGVPRTPTKMETEVKGLKSVGLEPTKEQLSFLGIPDWAKEQGQMARHKEIMDIDRAKLGATERYHQQMVDLQREQLKNSQLATMSTLMANQYKMKSLDTKEEKDMYTNTLSNIDKQIDDLNNEMKTVCKIDDFDTLMSKALTGGKEKAGEDGGKEEAGKDIETRQECIKRYLPKLKALNEARLSLLQTMNDSTPGAPQIDFKNMFKEEKLPVPDITDIDTTTPPQQEKTGFIQSLLNALSGAAFGAPQAPTGGGAETLQVPPALPQQEFIQSPQGITQFQPQAGATGMIPGMMQGIMNNPILKQLMGGNPLGR